MPASRVSPQALLDHLQAAETVGAEALGQWAATCDDPALRGGLRVIAARDAAHARLARERLAALGATATHDAPRDLQSLRGVLTAPDVSSRSKLAIVLARFPDQRSERMPAGIRDLDDDHTRALLEAMRDDDRTSLRWLHEAHDAPPSSTASVASEVVAVPDAVLAFLDAYRAAEAAGATVLAAWSAVTPSPGLRGGLEVLAAREATHAEQLGMRLRELGGTERGRLDADVLARALVRFGSADVTDEDKLAHVMARNPEPDAVARPALEVAAALSGDAETREMLRIMAAGETATIGWLRSYRDGAMTRPREGSLRVIDGGR
jgi:hypothetical protein